MPLSFKDRERSAHTITRIVLWFMVCYGLALVLAQVKPFWIDEWRLIYNLKYKSCAELWGSLEFMQQFPRGYLSLIKLFSAPFDYSYFTLRFPSFLAGTITILFAYRLMDKIYTQKQVTRFLFVLIIVSSHTFTAYFIQVKQYTMEILLSLLAIWQLLQLIKLDEGAAYTNRSYLLLCITFLVAPFFSYTYPIVVAPVFFIVFCKGLQLARHGVSLSLKIRMLTRLWFPLSLAAVGIVAFYLADAAQLMKDNGMQLYWGYLMMQHGFDLAIFCKSFFRLFAETGSGLLFELIFGLLGVVAFFYTMVHCAIALFKRQKIDYFMCYSVLMVIVVLALYTAGRLPIGEARLNSCVLPAMAMLIVSFINFLSSRPRHMALAGSITFILFLGGVGHVLSSSVRGLCGAVYSRTLNTYVNTENAIILAQEKKIPIFITSSIAYPDEKMVNFPTTGIAATIMCLPFGYTNDGCATLTDNIPGDWVLKTFPAYKVQEHIPVYALNDMSEVQRCIQQLPPDVKSVLAGDGSSFTLIER